MAIITIFFPSTQLGSGPQLPMPAHAHQGGKVKARESATYRSQLGLQPRESNTNAESNFDRKGQISVLGPAAMGESELPHGTYRHTMEREQFEKRRKNETEGQELYA